MTEEERKRKAFNDFYKAVVFMREAQKEYFRTRRGLEVSKQAERSVDKMIVAIRTGVAFNRTEQTTLAI